MVCRHVPRCFGERESRRRTYRDVRQVSFQLLEPAECFCRSHCARSGSIDPLGLVDRVHCEPLPFVWRNAVNAVLTDEPGLDRKFECGAGVKVEVGR